MGEDDGTELFFDEVDMQDLIDDWSRHYAEGVSVGGWYYDCKSSTALIRLLWETDGADDG